MLIETITATATKTIITSARVNADFLFFEVNKCVFEGNKEVRK
jgi:hypothetical protein